MAVRVKHVLGHLLPQSCAMPSMSPLASPTGKQYPPGTSIELQGNMEPVNTETFGALECIHGALPADLDGSFIRTGPNPSMNKDGQAYHSFNGDAMVHLFDLQAGVGSYRNRWVETKRRALEKEKGRELKFEESFDEDQILMGAANTAVVYHANKLMAVYETDRPYAMTVPDLETIGYHKYDGALKHTMTAHPKVCPQTGELFFFGYEMLRPVVHVSVVNPEGRLLSSLEIPTQCGKPVMMHDMAITQNYVLLLEFPLVFEKRLAMKGTIPYAHNKKLPSRFGIMPRHAKATSEIRWFQGKSGVAFHVANAWEEGHNIKLIAGYTESFAFFDPDSQADDPSSLYEWTFDMSTGKTEERYLETTNQDFLQINPSKVGSPNQYVWAVRFTGAQSAFHSIDALLKHDLKTGSTVAHCLLGGRFGGEAVFAPRANATDEDDGYLICCTYNPSNFTTELYVLDAKTMDPNPVAILRTPARVPFGFHAYWLPRQRA